MAQVFPVVTVENALDHTGWYLTQPALMAHAASASQRVVVHTTLNFEGLTQRDGETTYGAWGEGFIDSRHPHTLVHELMLSANFWNAPGGSFSISAGRSLVSPRSAFPGRAEG